MNLIAACALFKLALALFTGIFSATASAVDILPPDVAAALSRAGVTQDAISVLVTAIPSMATATTVTTTTQTAQPRLSLRADVPRNPASVMKLVTTYCALNALGPDFTWKNRIYIDGFIGQNGNPGVLDGNLIIRGSGDPKLVLERIQDLFAAVQAKGVREIRGDILLDRSVFNVPDKNPADFDDEPLRPYNAVPDGLLVNFKSLIFTFTPDEANQRVTVRYEPPIAGVEIPTEVSMAKGGCGDWKSALRADFFTPTKISFAGKMGAGCGEKVWAVAYSEPRAYAARVIQAMWTEAGGKLTGQVREAALPPAAKLLLSAESLPLSDIIADVNKFSNNVMAQQVFLTVSAQTSANKRGSFDASKRWLANWWKKNLPASAAPTIENGSGLSRRERTSASALTALLQYAAASPHAEVFANSLSIAGVDGTVVRMKDRNPESVALGRAQLKTGTLRDVAAVAGYVTSISGQRYSIVALVNHPNAGAARPALDKLVEWTARDGN